MRLRNSNSRPRPRNSSLSISHEVDGARDTDGKEKGNYNSLSDGGSLSPVSLGDFQEGPSDCYSN